MFNLRKPAVPLGSLDLKALTSRTWGAFVLELGDAEQHGSFDAFVRHIDGNTLNATWNADRNVLEVAYKSGKDLMEAAFCSSFGQPSETHFAIDPGQQEKAFPVRRLNGQWPYLPPGIERDNSWAQQGTTGRLEKNGAVLESEAGKKAYLIADPLSGGVIAYNPLPDPQSWKLTTRTASFFADGKLGLLRLEYRPWSNEVVIDHALKPDQTGDIAKRLTIAGLSAAPRVILNGRPVQANSVQASGKGPVFQVGLTP
jgi:hypothetical protein